MSKYSFSKIDFINLIQDKKYSFLTAVRLKTLEEKISKINKDRFIDLINNIELKSKRQNISTIRKIAKTVEFESKKLGGHYYYFENDKVLDLGPATIDSYSNKSFYIDSLPAGKYRIILFHSSDFLFKNRKSFLISFDLVDLLSQQAIKNRLSLKNISSKYGVFEYIGGGRKGTSIYYQDIYIDLKKDTQILKLGVNSQVDFFLNIDKIYLYNVENSENLKFDQNYFNGKIVSLGLSKKNENPGLVNVRKLKNTKIDVLICAEMNPNVIDGSSIWLTSVINILSKEHNVLVIFKQDIKENRNILSNIKCDFNYLQPSDFGLNGILNAEKLAELCEIVDQNIDSIKLLLTRGFDLGSLIQNKNTFYGRHMVYVTNFYDHNDQGIYISEDNKKKLNLLVCNSDLLLTQTPYLSDMIKQTTVFPFEEVRLPPSIPDNYAKGLKKQNLDKDYIHIGYAGKLKEDWAVEELINWSLNSKLKIKVHLAIARLDRGDENYYQRMSQLLKNKNLVIYEGLDRFQVAEMMGSMDYSWSYRRPHFEINTLELSTKLLESVALGVPTICYPSKVNVGLLGEDYKFYVRNEREYITCLSRPKRNNKNWMRKPSGIVIENHSFSNVAVNFNFIKDKIISKDSLSKKKICFAGNDYKFIEPFISFLKRNECPVRKDIWEWGKHTDLAQTKENYDWADLIFCEWGLANAVWFSNNNTQKKPLFIRIHAQEVRERARHFGAKIAIENVTKVIFISERVRNEAIKLWNWPREKTMIIPNFFLSDRFTMREQPLGLTLGMVGIVPQLKRFDRAVDLLELLVNKGYDAKLCIKGHRPEDIPFMHAPSRRPELDYYYKIYNQIESNPLIKDRVIFSGWGNDVALWYQDIDFILSPSDSEGSHNAFGEGILSGCLPIGWPWEGFEFTYNKKWLIKDTEDAANRVIEYWNNRDNVNKLRVENRKEVESFSSPQVVFKQLMEELEL